MFTPVVLFLGSDNRLINQGLGRAPQQSSQYYTRRTILGHVITSDPKLGKFAVDGDFTTESRTWPQGHAFQGSSRPWWKIFINLGAHQRLTFIRIHRECLQEQIVIRKLS